MGPSPPWAQAPVPSAVQQGRTVETMAIMDEMLGQIVQSIEPAARDAGLLRTRGGLVRGVSWAELAGRGTDGTWYELRLHHRTEQRTLQAGLLAYRPLAQGGRTLVVGEATHTYQYQGEQHELADQIAEWLSKVSDGAVPQM